MAAAAAAALAWLLFLLGCLPGGLATAVSFSYSSFSSASNDVTLQGSAVFGNAGCINITGNIANTMGRVSYTPPVQLQDADTKEVASFTTRFSINIIPNNIDNKGDGMAFFLVSHPSTMPGTAAGGTLGLASEGYRDVRSGDNRFVAVEFDTFNNSDIDPNATFDHIGIDVNSLRSVKNESLPNFSLIGNMTADVRFDADSSILSMQLWINGSTTPYNINSKVDVTRYLPGEVAVGFSASTGSAVELHQLCSWSFNSSFKQKQLKEVPTPPPPTQQPSPSTSGVVAGVTAGAALLVVLLFAITAVLVRRRRRKKRREADQEAENVGSDGDGGDDYGDPIVEIEMGTGPRRFPYHELVNATKSFAAEEKLGQGGFGAVYRGHLSELGLAVAIKRFAKESSGQGRKEYTSEIKVISRLRHRNLVQLIGWCHGRGELLLVYELVPNRSLDIHLHDHDNGTFLTWPMRIKIVFGLGSALLYLHDEWEQCVVHRDIKPSNVMLDESFNAKLGDFGLARFIDHAVGVQTMTAISGTPGYVDPECVITGKASAESDVYSFGVVLLEVACGRRPISPLSCEKNGVFRLVEWAWDLYGRGAVLTAADERLNGDYDAAEMERVIAVGLWCAHPDPSARPSIKAAMAALHFSGQLPVLPPKMPVPTYGPPMASLDGLFASSTGTSSVLSSSTTTSSYATHTSCSSDSSTSAGLKDSSSLLKHQY
ncbi:hypothetical protein ABZP36_025204 [Zizania latifolia]